MEKIIINRHLEDKPIEKGEYNNLDTSLKKEECQNPETLKQMFSDLNTMINEYDKVLVLTSSKKRVKETAKLIVDKFTEEEKKKIQIKEMPEFSEINQGVSIQPSCYKEGDKIHHLSEAWKIFWEETFQNCDLNEINNIKVNDIELKNPEYKFGSLTERNELWMYDKVGESYVDLNYRIYKGVLKLLRLKSRGLKKNNEKKTGIYIFTHSAIISVFKSLNKIGKDWVELEKPFENLLIDSWKEYIYGYQKRDKTKGGKKFGHREVLDISYLNNIDKLDNLIKNLNNIIKYIEEKYYGKKAIQN